MCGMGYFGGTYSSSKVNRTFVAIWILCNNFVSLRCDTFDSIRCPGVAPQRFLRTEESRSSISPSPCDRICWGRLDWTLLLLSFASTETAFCKSVLDINYIVRSAHRHRPILPSINQDHISILDHNHANLTTPPTVSTSATHTTNAMPYLIHHPHTKKPPTPPPPQQPQQQPHNQPPSIRISAVAIILITWDLLVHEYLIWYRLFSPTYWWLLMASVSFPLAVATSWPEERREGESGWIVWRLWSGCGRRGRSWRLGMFGLTWASGWLSLRFLGLLSGLGLIR
jgi:hypothetical protein